MATRSQHVVVTGMGIVSPAGIGRASFWQAIQGGRSSIRRLTGWDMGTLPLKIGGEVLDFDPGKYIQPRKAIKLMCRDTQLGCAAAALAMEDSGATSQDFAPERLGVIFGSQMFYGRPDELSHVFWSSREPSGFSLAAWGRSFPRDMFPLWLLLYLPNMPACHIAIAHKALGPNNTIVQGAASGLLAIIEAATVIERGWADAMLAGGVGNMICPTRVVYLANEDLSQRNDDPASACRPFDATRDGTVMAEGSAVFLLESREHAIARGAQIQTQLAGFGRAFGPVCGSVGSAHRSTVARCLSAALASAQLQPRDIGHVNAHGAGIVETDRQEAQAIRDVLGDTPVTAPKSYFGNSGAACGTLETAVSILGTQAGEIPPTLNYERPDPDCPIQVVHGAPLAVRDKAWLAMNQSTTGQVATVAFIPS